MSVFFMLEDDPNCASVISKILRGEGAEVIKVDNLMEGGVLLQRHADKISMLYFDACVPIRHGGSVKTGVATSIPLIRLAQRKVPHALLFGSSGSNVDDLWKAGCCHVCGKPIQLIDIDKLIALYRQCSQRASAA